MTHLEVGAWVRIHDGRTARIVEVDLANGAVLAATASGHPIERPIGFAEIRWQSLSEEGLQVRMAVSPSAVRGLVDTEPADLVIAALLDLAGQANARALREVLTPDPIPVDGWEAWWGKVQPRLKRHPRIDTSQLRRRIYRLGSNDGTRVQGSVSLVQDERRNGRALVDGKVLAQIRALASTKKGISPDEQDLADRLVALSARDDIDATDRFLTAELGVSIGSLSEDDAKERLGDDLLEIDLLRVRSHDSRDRAIAWSLHGRSEPPDPRAEVPTRRRPPTSKTLAPPILLSAAALGDPWAADVRPLADALGRSEASVAYGLLGWAPPGSPDAGPSKFPADLEVFGKRVERAKDVIASAPKESRTGIVDGALRALDSLGASAAHHVLWMRVMSDLAVVVWSDAGAMPDALTPGRLDALRPDGWAALVRMAPGSRLLEMRPALLRRFGEAPVEFRGVLHEFAERSQSDVLKLVIEAARSLLDRSQVPAVAALALDIARQRNRQDPLVFESATLGGTTAPHYPGVSETLEVLANEIGESLLRLERQSPVPVWFSGLEWERFANRMVEAQASADSSRRAAIAEADRLRSELAQLNEALKMRTEALTATRTEASLTDRSASRRVAAASLRPVALALGDSFESNSLVGLQEALEAALGRAHIRTIGRQGEIVKFDPSRHRWVGTGPSADEVMVLSPGFAIDGEGGEDDVVLAPARVVDRSWQGT